LNNQVSDSCSWNSFSSVNSNNLNHTLGCSFINQPYNLIAQRPGEIPAFGIYVAHNDGRITSWPKNIKTLNLPMLMATALPIGEIATQLADFPGIPIFMALALAHQEHILTLDMAGTRVPTKHPKTTTAKETTVVSETLQMDQELVLVRPMERVQCDQCPARAYALVTLSTGDLAFCHHHYNKSAQALTERGAVAKLLDISQD